MNHSSRTPIVCGVDIGTTNAKVVALDAAGVVVARASRRTPRDAEGLWIDAAALFNTIEEMVAEVCGHTYVLHAICAAGVGEDGVLVDESLRPLTKALAWFDPRRQSIFRTLRPELYDDDSFDADSDAGRTLVGWKWSRNQTIAQAPNSWVALADWAAVCWSGRTFLSDTLASRTGAWRSRDREWAYDRVELTLGSAELLPPVLAAGDIAGGVRSPLLQDAGLVAPDAITVVGGHDHPIGGWGVDQMVPGAVLDSMGTAEVVVVQSSLSRVARRNHVDVAPGICSSGTTLLRVEELARNVEWASQDPDVATQIRLILRGEASVLSVLDAGYFIPGQSGGGRPAYSLDAPADPHARAWAVLGALAHRGLDAVDAVRGETSEVRLAGGWVRSPGWVEIKAMVNGYPTEVILEPEVTAVGAALLAARARGWVIDSAQAFERSVAAAW
jgi:sugar (pentulose or hexulose) kinase